MNSKWVVLIVDDEPLARDVMQGFLFKEGYILDSAENAIAALKHLESNSPDIILLDVMMPGMDGYSLCRRLKSEEQWRHIPVILVTALSNKEDLVRGLEAGADDFLTKPVSEIELRARVRSMLRIRKQYNELQEMVRLRDDLAHMIVHDMRTPLTTILGFSSLLQNQETMSSQDVEDLRKIYVQAQRLSEFLNSLLMIAKAERTGQLVVSYSLVDINQLVRQVCEDQGITIGLKYINLVLNLPEESPQMQLDSHLFHRVLDNLLSNALKYSPPQSTVTVKVENISGEPEEAPRVRIKVIDEGPGIPEEHRHRIFDKYEIVSMKQQDVSRIGLGLAFCKLVVEAHNGNIFVEANEPAGAIFVIEI